MPTTLGPRYSVDWRGRPPHMLQPDIPVWWRFLETYGSPIINLYYDCLLGGPPWQPGEELDPMRRMWRTNVSKRADAIAELRDEVWIIEVADDPGLRAVGQLLSYRALWLRDPKFAKIERMLLVCNKVDPDLFDVCGIQGIQVYVI